MSGERKHVMDCDDCLERLYTYLDKELSTEDLAAVRGHLDDCVGCEERFVIEKTFLDEVRDHACKDVAPPQLRERIVMRLREGPPPPGH